MGIRKPPVMKPYNPRRKFMSKDEALKEDAALRDARLKADKAFEEEYKKAMGTSYNPELKKAQDELAAKKQLIATRVAQVKKLEEEYKNDPQDQDIKQELQLAKKKVVEAEEGVKKQEDLITRLSV